MTATNLAHIKRLQKVKFKPKLRQIMKTNVKYQKLGDFDWDLNPCYA